MRTSRRRRRAGAKVARGPSYREAKGGAFDFFFHHKRAVRAITDFQPPVGDNEIDLLCRGQAVSVSQETAPESAPARLAGAL